MSLFLPLTTHYHCEHITIAGVSFSIFTQHVLRETSISFTAILYWSRAQRSHQTSTQTCIHQPFVKETILVLCDRWLGIYDMHQLTCLAPHNELGDGDCHHLLIIPMVEMLPVMSCSPCRFSLLGFEQFVNYSSYMALLRGLTFSKLMKLNYAIINLTIENKKIIKLCFYCRCKYNMATLKKRHI